MAFIDKISQDLTAAMRAKDQLRLDTLRMTKAALMNREVEKKRALDDAESQQVVVGMIKQRRDSVEQFRAGGRPELADKEQAEIAILEAYLPPAMDAAELEGIVIDAIAEAGATSPKDMGRVMKGVMARLAGRAADGKIVSELVKKKLAGG
jgi:uncharacterized protein YqeY